MYYITGSRQYTKNMIKVMLFVCGLLIGSIVGLYVAAQIFPLSTQETVYIRSVR